MMKNFSLANLDNAEVLSKLVRAASKLSIQEFSLVTGGSEADADAIVTVSTCRARRELFRNFSSCSRQIYIF